MLKDYARLALAWERENEVYNLFGLLQGIQSDSFSLSGTLRLDGRSGLEAVARYISYNDHNDGMHFRISGSREITRFPGVLKAVITGEYRNTGESDVEIRTAGALAGITHPYWTPRNYYAGQAGLEWYQAYSNKSFCGQPPRYFNLALAGATDSEGNPAVQLSGELRHGFGKGMEGGLKALLYRSRLWRADGVWLDLAFRF
jgi:hypothetical protein